MTKRDPYGPIWRKRQFILKDGVIYYFRGGDARVNNADLVGKIDLCDDKDIRIRIAGGQFGGSVDGNSKVGVTSKAGSGKGSRGIIRKSAVTERGSRVDMTFALAALKQSGLFAQRQRGRKGSTTNFPLVLGAAITATSTMQSKDMGPNAMQPRVRGTAIVTALVQSGNIPCRTRREAVAVGQRLLDHAYIRRISMQKGERSKEFFPRFFTQGFKASKEGARSEKFRDNQDLYILIDGQGHKGPSHRRADSDLAVAGVSEVNECISKVAEFSDACEWHLITRSREYHLRARSPADARDWAKAV